MSAAARSEPAPLAWDEPDPADCIPLSSDGDWLDVLHTYDGRAARRRTKWSQADSPLKRCLQVARDNGAVCVVVETRYIDRDWRAEHNAFYARAFTMPPDTAHRLHFFTTPVELDDLGRLPERSGVVDARVGYLGFVVVRPLNASPVGRTMLVPPSVVAAAVRTAVTERVMFFGQAMSVTAVPFMEQDSQYAVCAHAAIWTCAYHGYLNGEMQRTTIAEVVASIDPSLGLDRTLPSNGLSELQVAAAMHALGLGATAYSLDEALVHPDTAGEVVKPDADAALIARALSALVCRYLNSARPVVAVSEQHAVVLCGWSRPAGAHRSAADFVLHDDQVGPYQALTAAELIVRIAARGGEQNASAGGDAADDGGGATLAWTTLFVPLPEKVWRSGEDAEFLSRELIGSLLDTLARNNARARDLRNDLDSGGFALRSYLVASNDFKRRLALRGLPPDIVTAYRRARWPRFVWVTELVRRDVRSRRATVGASARRCVEAEVVLDPTDWHKGSEQRALAVNVAGHVILSQTSGSPPLLRHDTAAWRTGGAGPA